MGSKIMLSPMWHPSERDLQRSRLLSFMHQHNIDDPWDLIRLSVQDEGWYWLAVMQHLGIESFQRVKHADGTDHPEQSRSDADTFNCIHNALDIHVHRSPSRVALVGTGIFRHSLQYTYEELHQIVNSVAHALSAQGIHFGDTVALFLPTLPERVILLLACASLGAICSPVPIYPCDENTLVTHLIQSGAKLLITTDWYPINGNLIATKTIADRASIAAPHLEYIVTIPYSGRGVSWLDCPEPRNLGQQIC